jgi:hypothetical protein
MQKYPKPREYAEKVILKKLKSNETIAALLAITSAINSPSDHIFTPGQINKKIASDI